MGATVIFAEHFGQNQVVVLLDFRMLFYAAPNDQLNLFISEQGVIKSWDHFTTNPYLV